jgi:hypothetical protein
MGDFYLDPTDPLQSFSDLMAITQGQSAPVYIAPQDFPMDYGDFIDES